jgi:seryl-tRNA(Sec) selenium transferase
MAFARVDHQKQNYERRMKKHAEREWEKEVDEKNKMLAEVERQKQWEQGREHRVGNWKEFGTDETRKKVCVCVCVCVLECCEHVMRSPG